ncbi:MAG: ABC transporter permease subunit [Lacipirellulaceae bacterium]
MQTSRTILFSLCVLAFVALGYSASPRLLALLGMTAWLTLGTLAISLPVGTLLGIAIGKVEFAWRGTLTCLLVSLLFVPLYVQAAAWHAAFGYGGWLQQWFTFDSSWFQGLTAAIIIHAAAAVPFVTLLCAASLATAARSLEEQSLLDAKPQQVLSRVSLPHAAGGILAAAAWVALTCTTEICVTDLFQVRTFAEEIFTQASLGTLSLDEESSNDLLIGILMIMFMATGSALLLTPWAIRTVKNSWVEQAWRWKPQHRWPVSLFVWLIASIFIAVPIASLAWKAGHATDPNSDSLDLSWSLGHTLSISLSSLFEFRREFGWSLLIGICAALVCTTAATLAFWLAKRSSFSLGCLFALVVVLLAIPAPLLGVWTVRFLNQPDDSLLSPLSILYDRTIIGCVLVQSLRAFPIAVAMIATQLSTIPTELADAARSEGAGWWRQLLRVVIPMRLPSLIATLLVCTAISMAEISATFLVLPPGVTPLSRRLFGLLHYGADDRVAAVSLGFFLLVVAITAIAMRAFGKKGQTGRRS